MERRYLKLGLTLVFCSWVIALTGCSDDKKNNNDTSHILVNGSTEDWAIDLRPGQKETLTVSVKDNHPQANNIQLQFLDNDHAERFQIDHFNCDQVSDSGEENCNIQISLLEPESVDPGISARTSNTLSTDATNTETSVESADVTISGDNTSTVSGTINYSDEAAILYVNGNDEITLMSMIPSCDGDEGECMGQIVLSSDTPFSSTDYTLTFDNGSDYFNTALFGCSDDLEPSALDDLDRLKSNIQVINIALQSVSDTTDIDGLPDAIDKIIDGLDDMETDITNWVDNKDEDSLFDMLIQALELYKDANDAIDLVESQPGDSASTEQDDIESAKSEFSDLESSIGTDFMTLFTELSYIASYDNFCIVGVQMAATAEPDTVYNATITSDLFANDISLNIASLENDNHAALQFSSEQLQFDSSNNSQSVTIKAIGFVESGNTLSEPIQFGSAAIENDNGDYSINADTCSNLLFETAQATCSIEIENTGFSGESNALVIAADSGNISLPLSTTVSGLSVVQSTDINNGYTLNSNDAEIVVLSGQNSNANLRLENNTGRDLIALSIQIDGALSSGIDLSGCSDELTSGDTCSISLTYSGEESTGTFSAISEASGSSSLLSVSLNDQLLYQVPLTIDSLIDNTTVTYQLETSPASHFLGSVILTNGIAGSKATTITYTTEDNASAIVLTQNIPDQEDSIPNCEINEDQIGLKESEATETAYQCRLWLKATTTNNLSVTSQSIITFTTQDSQTNSIVASSTKTLLASGNFTLAGERPLNYIAEWNGDEWDSLGVSLSSYAIAMAYSENDTAVYLYGPGTIDGTEITGVAQWQGANWKNIGDNIEGITKLKSANENTYALMLNSLLVWEGTQWSTFATIDTTINDFHIDGSQNAYLSGDFSQVSGVNLDYLAKWSGSSWESIEPDIFDTLTEELELNDILSNNGLLNNQLEFGAIDTDSNENLYVTGTHKVGTGVYQQGEDNWNMIGTAGSLPTFLSFTEDDALYIGGDFQRINGIVGLDLLGQVVNHVAVWQDGWQSLQGGVVGIGNSSIDVFAHDTEAGTFFGGYFQAAGTSVMSNIGLWDPVSKSWTSLDGGLNDRVTSMLLVPRILSLEIN